MTTTYEEVLNLFREIAETQKNSEKRLNKLERIVKKQSAKTERRFQETERFIKEQSIETERRFQETERFIKEQSIEAERRFQETERRFQETDARMDKRMKELSIQLGNLGNRLGEFVEEQVMPSALKLIQDFGIDVHEIQRRVNAKRSGKTTEIDLLLVNDTDIVAIEVKSSLSIDYVKQHINRLNNFKLMFPRYVNMRVYGAVAAMVVPDDAKQYGLEAGLFVLVPATNMMCLANNPAFTPRVW